jgi:hypothetical protein
MHRRDHRTVCIRLSALLAVAMTMLGLALPAAAPSLTRLGARTAAMGPDNSGSWGVPPSGVAGL